MTPASPPALHLVVDLIDVAEMPDCASLGRLLETAALEAGATVLHSHFHPFPGGGATGVVLLAESHISIHTWPEHRFAALDVFMCGAADPEVAISRIVDALRPTSVKQHRLDRSPVDHLNQASQPA